MELDNIPEIFVDSQNPNLSSEVWNRIHYKAVIEERSGTVPLHLAILHSPIDAIKDVLEGGAHVNVRNKAGETALHIAAGADELEKVEFLLKHGADVKAETNLKHTSLHIAVWNKNAEVAEFLILHCYSMIDSSDHTGNTPLHYAVRRGNLEIVEILLKADADPNIGDNDGYSPFLLALKKSNEDLVFLLIRYGARLGQKTAKDEGVMHLACRFCNETIITRLIGRKLNVHSVTLDGSSTLHYAAMNENSFQSLSYVSLLLDYGVNPNVVDKNNYSPIMIALQNFDSYVIRRLILGGASLPIADPRTGLTPLMMAVKSGNLDIVEILLKADADPNIRNNDGDSPFLLALKKGNEDLVLLLMKYGARFEQKTTKGEGVMHLACRYCNDTIISRLIERNLNVHSVTLDGSSTLHYAAMNENYFHRLSCVSLLLDYGVNPNVVDNNNYSPIMIAVQNFDSPVIRRLILGGASLSIADPRTGLTPLMMMVKQGSYLTVTSLMSGEWRAYCQFYDSVRASIRLCDHNQENVLHLAIKHLQGPERVSVIQELISNSVDVKQRKLENKTPIDLIIDKKKDFIYEMLDIVDFDETKHILDYNSLLMVAINHVNLAKANLMLVKGAQAENPCFIVMAIKCRRESILRKLIENGADVNAVDETGNSTLELAIEKQLVKIVNLLLLLGADINKVNQGRTPLMLATSITQRSFVNEQSVANVQILLRQIALMQHQGKFVHELNRQVIQESRFTDSKKFTTVIETYNNVLESMRNMPVTDDTPTTYYDLIVKPCSVLIGAYAGNKKLRAAARSCKKGHVLLEFSDILQMKYIQCLQRKNLIRVVRPSLHEIFHSKLPYELTCEIIDYMSNNDMRRYVNLAFPKIERNRQLDWY